MKSKLAKQKEALDIETILKEKYAESQPIQKEAKKVATSTPKLEKSKTDLPAKSEGKAAAAKTPKSEIRNPKSLKGPISKTARSGIGAPKKRDVVRVSVDFPRGLYESVVIASDERAQTLRDFLLTLVRQHFEG